MEKEPKKEKTERFINHLVDIMAPIEEVREDDPLAAEKKRELIVQELKEIGYFEKIGVCPEELFLNHETEGSLEK